MESYIGYWKNGNKSFEYISEIEKYRNYYSNGNLQNEYKKLNDNYQGHHIGMLLSGHIDGTIDFIEQGKSGLRHGPKIEFNYIISQYYHSQMDLDLQNFMKRIYKTS